MTRNEAKLYWLEDVFWEKIVKEIEEAKQGENVTIYQMFNEGGINKSYAIISLSDEIDNILESLGATHITPPNDAIRDIAESKRTPLYGDKDNARLIRRD